MFSAVNIEKARAWVLRHQTKARFLLVGGFNTLLGLSLFPLLYWLLIPRGLHYLEIWFFSQTICIFTAFLTNKYWVFRTSGNYKEEFFKFASFHFTIMLINLMALPLLVNLLDINPVIAQTLFALCVIFSSYFWYSQITFKKRRTSNGG